MIGRVCSNFKVLLTLRKLIPRTFKTNKEKRVQQFFDRQESRLKKKKSGDDLEFLSELYHWSLETPNQSSQNFENIQKPEKLQNSENSLALKNDLFTREKHRIRKLDSLESLLSYYYWWGKQKLSDYNLLGILFDRLAAFDLLEIDNISQKSKTSNDLI